ncbi:MAG: hypothetical protein JKY50_01125 [Oleispira sp.]|nr:hypothetical protein [Oleispira sp.]
MSAEKIKAIWVEIGEQYIQPLLASIKTVWLEINTYYAQTLGVEIKAIWPETDVYYLQPIAQAPIYIPIAIVIFFVFYFVVETLRLIKENKENVPKYPLLLIASAMNIVILLKAFWLFLFVLFIILANAMPVDRIYIFETPTFAIDGLNYLLALLPEDYRPSIGFQDKYFPSLFSIGCGTFFIGMSITYFGAKALRIPQESIAEVSKGWRPFTRFFSKSFRNLFVWPFAMIVYIASHKNQNYYDDF